MLGTFVAALSLNFTFICLVFPTSPLSCLRIHEINRYRQCLVIASQCGSYELTVFTNLGFHNLKSQRLNHGGAGIVYSNIKMKSICSYFVFYFIFR